MIDHLPAQCRTDAGAHLRAARLTPPLLGCFPPFSERRQLIRMLFLDVASFIIIRQVKVKKDIRVIDVGVGWSRLYGPPVGCRVTDFHDRPTVKVSRMRPVLPCLFRKSSESSPRRVLHPIYRNRVCFLAFKKNFGDDPPLPCSLRRPIREYASSDMLGIPQVRKLFSHVPFENDCSLRARN